MSRKLLKKFSAIILSAMILFGCAPSVFAATSDTQPEKAYGGLISARDSSVNLENVPIYTSARDILAMVISECSDVDEKDYAPGSYRLFTEQYENAIKLLNDESAEDKQLVNAYMNLLGEKVRMITVDRETGERSRTDEWMEGYEFGAILVELRLDSPTVQSLLSDFDIASVSLYPYDNPQNTITYVRFKEKTKEIVWRAIEVLKANSYVSSVEPHYWHLFDFIPDDGPRYRLENEVKDYSLFDSKDYTEESFKAYTMAYERAVELLADTNSTDEQFEAAYLEILKAKMNLVKVTEPTESTTSESASGLSKDELKEGYEFGAVLVGLNPGAPSVEQLLQGFEITESRLITPGSSTQNVYYVKFAEKTKEIVWKAIEVLKASPYVKYAEPNYFQGFPVEPPYMTKREKLNRLVSGCSSEVDEKYNAEEKYKAFIEVYENAQELLNAENATDEQLEEMFSKLLNARNDWIDEKYRSTTETTESKVDSTATQPPKGPSDEEIAEGYEFGAVLVGLNSGAPSVEQLLQGFEITESRLITPGSSTQNVYYVKFAEKTKEIVWKSIEVLKASSYVKYAEPNYLESLSVEPITDPTESETEQSQPTTEKAEPTTETPQPTTQLTTEQSEPTTESIQSTASVTDQTKTTTNSQITEKKVNKIKVTANTKTVKVKKLKNTKVTVKAIKVKNAAGTVSFLKLAKGSSNRLTINANTGKITVKKGTPKGTYKIKVKICAKGNNRYNPKAVTKTVKIKVMK